MMKEHNLYSSKYEGDGFPDFPTATRLVVCLVELILLFVCLHFQR
jgi:hypothetical protein